MSDTECVVTEEELDGPEGVYRAVRFVVSFCPSEPAIVWGLASVMCDYLRTAPADLRGPATDRVLELIRNDVRRSLQ